MDFGCGDGEFVFHAQQVLLESQWYGVELCESRISKQRHPVTIWQGDIFHESLHTYNVLHADNLCLDDGAAERLEAKILQEFRGIYVSYRTPSCFEFLRRAEFLEAVPVETTWTPQHPLLFYRIVSY